MKALLNKKIERLLDLINFLEVNGGKIETSLLIEKLNYTAYNLSVDILQANSIFSDILEINKNKHVEISYKNGNSYINAYSKAMESDPICKMLEKSFFNPNLDVSQMAKDLFVSQSTIYRWVDQFNDACVGHFNIYLETNPLVVKGYEWDVRVFFTNFFREKYPIYEWPFEFIDKASISVFFEKAIPNKYAKNFLYYYDSFHFQLAISMLRFSQGFRLASDDLYPNQKVQSLVNDIMEKEREVYFENCSLDKISYDRRFFEEIIRPFAGNMYAENYNSLLSLAEENPLSNKIIIYINKVISYLCAEFSIKTSNESELVLSLYNALLGSFARSISRYVLYSPYLIYQETIKNSFPEISHKIVEIIRAYNEFFSIPTNDEFVAYLFYVVWTTWKDLANQVTKPSHKLKVLVISRFSYFHAQSLRDQIVSYFGNLIDAYIIKELDLDVVDFDVSDFDLVISNFKVKGLNIPCIISEGIFSYKDYESISKTIFNMLFSPS